MGILRHAPCTSFLRIQEQESRWAVKRGRPQPTQINTRKILETLRRTGTPNPPLNRRTKIRRARLRADGSLLRNSDHRPAAEERSSRGRKETERKTAGRETGGFLMGESGRPDSNRRRPAWEAGILPTELRPRMMLATECSERSVFLKLRHWGFTQLKHIPYLSHGL